MVKILGLLGVALATGIVMYDPLSESPAPQTVVILMEPAISWSPDRPGEGTLFRIRVTASQHAPILGVHGSVAGEELHFEQLGDRIFESLAAAPIGSDSLLAANFRVVYATGSEERVEERIQVAPGTYVHEELRVAPRFGSAPDSADQVRLRRDRTMAARVARDAHRTPRLWTQHVVMPRASSVTSGFGDGRIFNGELSSRHMGLDLQGLQGDTVVAAARGVVALVEPFLLAGNIVYLNHGGGLLSAYFHLSEQLVQVGDTVDTGDAVGRIGATGRVTGAHLHWVVRFGRTSVDPRSLLSVTGSGSER